MRPIVEITLIVVLSLAAFVQAPPVQVSQADLNLRFLTWSKKYGYYNGKLDGLSTEDIAEKMREPLIEMKRFYHAEIEPNSHNETILTEEVLAVIARPRCGDKDVEPSDRKKRWSRLGRKWPYYPIYVSFSNFTTKVSKQSQERILMECAKMWAEYSGISFYYWPAGNGNIEIKYVEIDGPWNTVGIGESADYPKVSSLMLDIDEPWKENARTSRYGHSLKWAMCHELGHTISLGHSKDPRAMMYPNGNTHNDYALHDDDIMAIRTMYGPPHSKDIGLKNFPDYPIVRPEPVVSWSDPTSLHSRNTETPAQPSNRPNPTTSPTTGRISFEPATTTRAAATPTSPAATEERNQLSMSGIRLQVPGSDRSTAATNTSLEYTNTTSTHVAMSQGNATMEKQRPMTIKDTTSTSLKQQQNVTSANPLQRTPTHSPLHNDTLQQQYQTTTEASIMSGLYDKALSLAETSRISTMFIKQMLGF